MRIAKRPKTLRPPTNTPVERSLHPTKWLASMYPASRGHSLREKGRLSPLPSYSTTLHEKHSLRSRPSQWTTTYQLQLPWRRAGIPRRISIILPQPSNVYQSTVHRFGRRRAFAIFLGTFVAIIWTLLTMRKRFGTPQNQWPLTFQGDPPTLVYAREDLQRVWEWEIASGHYPSSRKSTSRVSLSTMNKAVDRTPSSTRRNKLGSTTTEPCDCTDTTTYSSISI
jgi:DDB1- and CUL4-associated factor 13